MKQRKKVTEKSRRRNLLWTMGIVEGVSLYAGLHLGYCYLRIPDDGGRTVFKAMEMASEHLTEHPFKVVPADPLMVGICLVIGMIGCLSFYNEYLKVKDTVEDAHGDAAFEEDYRQYDKEFVLEPEAVYEVKFGAGRRAAVREFPVGGGEDSSHSLGMTGDRAAKEKWVKKRAPYNEEHKRVLRRYPGKRAAEAMRMRAQIFSMHVFLSLNGFWTQRNMNALIFGASGTGKSRYFLLPNILQANSSLVVTDPSGDVMLKAGDFLGRRGYLLKCFSTVDMEHSCRFNPLQYIRREEDIPPTVNALMENTSGWKKNMSGDSNFWTQSTRALFCCAIGYLFEVAPVGQRNFVNVLEILRMDGRDEFSDPDEETDFDKLFQRLGEANPNSYAYQQYITYRKAPNKTALNIMISTTVMLSQYVDMAAFRNLIYKDEMELDRVGQEKAAVFLNIPEGDSTYAWISAMFFSVLFRILMKQGEERMKREGLGDPQLKVPVRCLIDECKNVGRIPNLEGVLSFCRKYRISIVPIFQSFSQLEELYGKGPANEFLSNCDTVMFLGGRDPATLKVICEEMGKRTVKVLSYSNSKGRGSSASVSKQQTGADLMTRVQLSQLSNQECLVFIRGLRPFKDEKYRLEKHPNYRYLAEGSLGRPLIDPFVIAYDDEELERCRLKAVGEDGYVEPRIVDSARRRALIERNRRKVAELERQVASLQVRLAEAVAKKKGTDRIEAGIERTMRMIKKLERILPERGDGEMDSREFPVGGSEDSSHSFGMTEKTLEMTEKAAGMSVKAGDMDGMMGDLRLKEVRFVGSFAPGFEFDEASEEDVKKIFGK